MDLSTNRNPKWLSVFDSDLRMPESLIWILPNLIYVSCSSLFEKKGITLLHSISYNLQSSRQNLLRNINFDSQF